MGEDYLTLVCPKCGTIFRSTLNVDPVTFEGMRIDQMLERCPVCCQATRFEKVDYLFRTARHEPGPGRRRIGDG